MSRVTWQMCWRNCTFPMSCIRDQLSSSFCFTINYSNWHLFFIQFRSAGFTRVPARFLGRKFLRNLVSEDGLNLAIYKPGINMLHVTVM